MGRLAPSIERAAIKMFENAAPAESGNDLPGEANSQTKPTDKQSSESNNIKTANVEQPDSKEKITAFDEKNYPPRIEELSDFLIDSYRESDRTLKVNNSGWLLYDDQLNDRGNIRLISQHSNKMAVWAYQNNNGTDYIRARNKALLWSQENSEKASDVPNGELVVQNIFNNEQKQEAQAAKAEPVSEKDVRQIIMEVARANPFGSFERVSELANQRLIEQTGKPAR